VKVTSLVLAVAGALFSFSAALWLLVRFDPMGERYLHVEGGGYGEVPTSPRGIRLLLRDQRKPAALATVGAALQLLGVVFAIWAQP